MVNHNHCIFIATLYISTGLRLVSFRMVDPFTTQSVCVDDLLQLLLGYYNRSRETTRLLGKKNEMVAESSAYSYYTIIQKEPPSSLISTIKEQTSEGITGPRFCKTCNHYKPPRTHHCRYCKRCVLKMDHHCPWIAQCVGHTNQGHFIRFVIYVCIACSYVLALLVGRVMAIMDAIRHFQVIYI